MTETIQIPRLARDMQAENVTVGNEVGGGRISFSASSDIALDRFFGTETLQHDARSVDMTRIDAQAAPLLFNHDWNDPIGIIESGRLADGRLLVNARFFSTQRAQDVRQMVREGLRNVSIGYEIQEMRERAPGDFVATRWSPHEISIAPVAADISIGVDRSAETKPARVTRAFQTTASTAGTQEVPRVDDQNTAPAADTAEESTIQTRELPTGGDKFDATAAEAQRIKAIEMVGQGNKIDSATVRHWIDSGADMNKVGDDLIEILKTRGSAANSPAMLGLSKPEVTEYSVLRAIRAAKTNQWKGAGLEFEAHRAMMERDNLQPHSNNSVYVPMDVQARAPRYGQRDFTAAVAGAAGGVGTDHLSGSFIDLLRNMSVSMRAGATRLTGLRGNVSIPKLTAGGTAYWLATEGTAITESTPTMGSVALTPRNVAALVEVSHQMAQQSDPSAEAMILTDLASVVALAADIGALRGDGTGGTPTGITNTAGVGAFPGTSLDYAAIVNAQTDVVKANAMNVGNLAFVMDPDTTGKLKTRVKFSGTASPIWEGNIMNGSVDGVPGMTSNQMEADSAIFGAWASLIIGEWGTLELAVDDKFNFTTGSLGLRAWYTMDVGIRYPGAFSAANTIT